MKIKDIGRVVTGKTPATGNAQYYNGKYMFIAPTDIAKGFVLTSSERTITEEGYLSISSNTLHGTSVLVGCIGSDMGNVAIVEESCATNQQINAITDIKCHVNPYYVYYYLSMRKSYLRTLAGVTTTPILPKSTFEEIDIVLPPKLIQDKVVNILYVLDDKIRQNARICAELESMAKTLYDYWFTQFDFPNAEGKPYRSSGGEMVWNDQLKREIPKGWKTKRLSDICSFRNGINYEKGCAGNRIYKIANVRNITASSLFMDVSDFDEISLPSEQADRYAIKRNDIIIARSGTPGATRLILKPADNVIFCGFIICCTPENSNHRMLLAHFLKQLEGTSATKTGGSILQNVSQDTLKSLCVAIPNDEVINSFNEKLVPMIEMIQHAIDENSELTKLRDWLLPMLMNGQIVVVDRP